MIHHDHPKLTSTTAMPSPSSSPWTSIQNPHSHQELKISYSDRQQHYNSGVVLEEPIPRLSISTLSEDSTSAISTDPHFNLPGRNSRNDDDNDDTLPSKRLIIMGHIRSFTFAAIKFILKNNNWALFVNLVHHLWGARKFIYSQAPRWRGSEIAHDVSRVAGAMHLAFAALTGMALKRKRLSTDRSTLLVLILAAVGRTYAYATSFWRRQQRSGWPVAAAAAAAASTVESIRYSGLLDIFVLAISSLAYSKTLRRSGRLF